MQSTLQLTVLMVKHVTLVLYPNNCCVQTYIVVVLAKDQYKQFLCVLCAGGENVS